MSLVCCGFCFVSSFSQMLWKSIVLRQLQRTGNGIHTSLVIPSLVNVASLLLNTVVIIPMNTVFVWIVAYLFSFSFRQSQGGCAWPEYEEARNLKRQDDKRYPQNFKWRRGEAHTHTHTHSQLYSSSQAKQYTVTTCFSSDYRVSLPRCVQSRSLRVVGAVLSTRFATCGELVDGRLV